MSTKNGKQQASVSTRLLPAREGGTLTWLEEIVVRMARGVSEEEEFVLEFRGGAYADTRARLALMEADALEALGVLSDEDPGLREEGGVEVDGALKARILARLSGREEED